MTAPIYGPWIAHNATPDSACPPDAVGKRGQIDCIGSNGTYSRVKVNNLATRVLWTSEDVLRYRILIEPVRGEIVLTGDDGEMGWVFAPTLMKGDTHRLTLPTLDGALIPGEYIGPDGAVIKVEVV